jgi:hypothetical protein
MDILDLLVEKIDEKVGAITEDLSTGTAKDIGEYRYVCGTIKGLLAVRDYIGDIRERLDED